MRFLLLLAAASIVTACSGTTTTLPGDDGGTGNDGGSDGATASDGNAADTGNGGDSGAACPDERGSYSIQLSGQGCGDTSANVKECITQADCTITLTSTATTAAKGLNGTTPIQTDGSFTGAAIGEGTLNRTGCVGAWDNNASTLTIDCGGVNSSQSCRAVLTRTSTSCQ